MSAYAIPVALSAALIAAPLVAGAAGSETFRNGESLYGQPATNAAHARVVDVTSATHVNVAYGETIVFTRGPKRFGWTFNGLELVAVPVHKISPSEFDGGAMTVYVGKNPLIRN